MQLKRTNKIHDYINEFQIKIFDNPKYMFALNGNYTIVLKESETIGWTQDSFLIFIDNIDDPIGYIQWYYNREHNYVSNITIMIEPDYLSNGYGAIALLKLTSYLLITRGFRKIVFKVHPANKKSHSLYTKLIKRGIGEKIGTMKEHVKLMDGKYYDVDIFELFARDLKDVSFDHVIGFIED